VLPRAARQPPATGRHTTWAAWKAAHPETDVMAPDPAFERRYFDRRACRRGDAFLPGDFPGTIKSRDPRLELADLLLGVRVGGFARAYPLMRLVPTSGVVEERLGEVPITVWWDAASHSGAAFDARLDGRTLSFQRVEPGRFRERAGGSVFDLEGRAVEGPLAGRALARVESLLCEWYGWFAHHPETSIWQP
jgi:hypothetical protein